MKLRNYISYNSKMFAILIFVELYNYFHLFISILIFGLLSVLLTSCHLKFNPVQCQFKTCIGLLFQDPFQKAFEEQKRKLTLLFMWVVVFASSIMTFAGCFILFPHTERVNFSKQLQMMTGASPFTYWLSSFIVDYCYTASVLAVTLASIYLFDQYGILSHSPEFGQCTL